MSFSNAHANVLAGAHPEPAFDEVVKVCKLIERSFVRGSGRWSFAGVGVAFIVMQRRRHHCASLAMASEEQNRPPVVPANEDETGTCW